ncbi:MAG TPA: tetratricopeptide repeat protein [Ktedonobacterales bacterium]|nr:tetratricopeptide repeat protein [Ktedonobacterales bacterium]
MGRRGSSSDWDDARDVSGSRSGRGGPQDSGQRGHRGGPQDGGRYRDDDYNRPRLSGAQVAGALREAQQLQQDGQLFEAIELCEELLDGGVDRPDVHYFLGWLYQEADRWGDAAGRFELLLNDPDYALSCYYALGQCARAEGNIEQAAHYFDEAVDRVNLDALTRDESDQLLQLCQEAAEAHREMNDLEGAETVYTALLGFLRSQGWQDQVAEIERMMHETLGSSPQPPRRRKPAEPSRPLGGNIPQRMRGKGAAPDRAAPDAGANRAPASAADPLASQPSAQMPAAQSPADAAMSGLSGQLGAAGMPGNTALDGNPAGGYGSGDMGLGGPLGGAGGFYSSEMPPAGQSDPLANIIRSLGSGMSGVRSGVNSLPEAQRAQVTQALRDIENYVAHGLLTAAIEECLRVMEIAPQYLDVHLMLGEVYVRQGKIEQAVAKYAILVDSYLVNNRLDDAISTYRRILQLEPNNTIYRVKLIELLSRQGRADEVLAERMSAADSYLRLGYADRAIQEYEQAMLANPNNVQVRLNYAQALMKANRAQFAVQEYQHVLQADPANMQALGQMQIALATGVGVAPSISAPGANGNRVAALETLGRLLRGVRAERLRSYDTLARDYLQALDQHPANPDLRFALGQLHLLASRQPEALTCFQQVKDAPGLETLAHCALGQTLLIGGDPANAAKAAGEFEEALRSARMNPPDPAIWAARPRLDGEEHRAPEPEISMLLATAYQASGKTGQAQSTLNTIQQQPTGEVYKALAEVSARQLDPQAALQENAQLVRHHRNNRQIENAVTTLKEMARVAPDDPAVRSELGDINISRGLLDEGLSDLRQLADIHVRRGQVKEAAVVYQRMAEICWGSEDRNEALSLLRQAIQYSTDDMLLRQQFVQYCLEINRKPEASEQQTVIARYYFATRQTKEAVAALQQLIGMDSHNYEAYDLLGQTYYSVGEYEQAARVYRNLAKVDPNSAMARARLQELNVVRSQMR